MADNVTLNAGSGGDTAAADDIGGVKYQRVKVVLGANNTNDGDVASGNPMPVSGTVDLGATDNAVLDAIEAHLVNLENCIVQDDAPFTPATGYLMMIGGEYDDSAPDSVDEGDAGNVRITANRSMHMSIRDGAGNERGANVNASNRLEVSPDARAATSDNIGAALMTNVIHDGTTALTPKFAVIDEASSGDNTLVAAVTDKKIRVLAAFMVAAGDVTARFEDGAAGTALTGQMNLTLNSGFTLPFNPVGWFETSANTLLNLELSAATSVDGSLVYVEV